MVLATSPSNEALKGSAKRMLFSKPSWSRTQNLGSSELFHRSEQVYVASAAEFKRKRREANAKKQVEQAPDVADEQRASKRPRMIDVVDDDDDDDDDDEEDEYEEDDQDDEDDDYRKANKDGNGDDHHGSSHRPALAHHATLAQTPKGRTQKWERDPSTFPHKDQSTVLCDDRQQRNLSPRSAPYEEQKYSGSIVIDLDSYDDDVPTKISHSPTAEIQPLDRNAVSEADDITASEDEFPELARKAREKARRVTVDEKSSILNSHLSSSSAGKDPHFLPLEAPSLPDPVLQILITSSIPDTTPLIVSRKLSQRLKDVRLAWSDRQHFPSHFTQQVFLTWRGKRLFDVTTCKSLGIAVDSEGRIIAKDDVLGTEEGRIHMEAMTNEILESRRKAKVEAAGGNVGTLEKDRPVETKVENQIRIILKSKGFDDCKLKVKATTPISKILNAFRQANSVASEKDVYIMFEGQRLETVATMEDAEITDLDTLDTYVK